MTTKRKLIEYFSSAGSPRQVSWRMKCYEDGALLASGIERTHFALKGKKVLDMACGWGGHAIAFAHAGAQVVAADLNDHDFARLSAYCKRETLPIRVMKADCQRVPTDEKFDVILALDLIEHIESPDALAQEIRRLLAPGGICILTTPPKLLSAIWGEPHWGGLKGIALLPLAAQSWIARKLFGLSYPFPITHQFLHAGQVAKLFSGMRCTAHPVSRKFPIASLPWGRFEITADRSAD